MEMRNYGSRFFAQKLESTICYKKKLSICLSWLNKMANERPEGYYLCFTMKFIGGKNRWGKAKHMTRGFKGTLLLEKDIRLKTIVQALKT